MPAKKIKTKTVEKSRYRAYLKKAEEFYETALSAQEPNNWNAVGLNAVHCAISSADSLLVFYTGKRSSDESHQAVVELLKLIELPDVRSKAETLRKVLEKKNLVAYEDREFSRNDALQIIKLAERFLAWVKSILSKA